MAVRGHPVSPESRIPIHLAPVHSPSLEPFSVPPLDRDFGVQTPPRPAHTLIKFCPSPPPGPPSTGGASRVHDPAVDERTVVPQPGWQEEGVA
eukprot:445757-Pleurochrysis_carterae.AAC.1